MVNVLGLTTAELQAVARSCGQPEYRGKQLARWVFQQGELRLEAMTNLPKAFRDQLALGDPAIGVLTLVTRSQSPDGTAKQLFGSKLGGTLEAVLMPYFARESQPDRVTACISTQIGCAVGCVFCATGFSGFGRNVTAGEMVEQVVRMQRDAGLRVSNVVFMGMGEPLLNYEETLKAVRLLNTEVGIGMRHLTLSTSGIVPGIDRLAEERLQLTLAVSLHAPNDRLRDFLVPINRRYPLGDLKAAMRRYVEHTGRRVTVEYVMLRGVNDDLALARELSHYLDGLGAHVNLIPYNATDAEFAPSPPRDVAAFREVLERSGRTVTVRVERGGEIAAACGQLRRRQAETGAAILEKSPPTMAAALAARDANEQA
ncbi:MAG: 23S rRNA (adenine(2503)-C(2))-methyltransferase RlmN [Cyanobacteria bacterium REEB65]|nr:23S rRNA (adenine(2503)-C(2))-methyltransferase RlmN [Cyanobacteria bacterium REEB65]